MSLIILYLYIIDYKLNPALFLIRIKCSQVNLQQPGQQLMLNVFTAMEEAIQSQINH